jgi:hypothetical protein
MRCSVSTTSPGEWSFSRWGWPVKSVTVTNRSSGIEALDDDTRDEVRYKLGHLVRSRWFEPPFDADA